MLKNKTKILFVLFVRHIELQNFLIALRIYDVIGHHRHAIDRQASYTAYHPTALT